MCVILVCPDETARPTRDVLEACHDANPHGAGMAWRENSKVRWMKNLDVDDVEALLAELDGEVIIHFRWASVGGIDADLCHPFPVTRWAKTDLFGEADTVLFQNGTWPAYDEALRRLRHEHKKRLPRGPMSDTRAAALCVHSHGRRILSKLPGRWAWMNAAQTRLYGPWAEFRGMKVSNRNFMRRLGVALTGGLDLSDPAACAGGFHQSELWTSEAPENGDQNGATPRATAQSLISSLTLTHCQ